MVYRGGPLVYRGEKDSGCQFWRKDRGDNVIGGLQRLRTTPAWAASQKTATPVLQPQGSGVCHHVDGPRRASHSSHSAQCFLRTAWAGQPLEFGLVRPRVQGPVGPSGLWTSEQRGGTSASSAAARLGSVCPSPTSKLTQRALATR